MQGKPRNGGAGSATRTTSGGGVGGFQSARGNAEAQTVARLEPVAAGSVKASIV